MNSIIGKALLFIKRISGNYLSNRVNIIRHGIATGFKRRGGIGILGISIKPTKEEEFIRALDLKNQIAFDIGANFGAFTLYLSKAVGPSGKVVAFEPLSANIDLINQNLSLNRLGTNTQVIKKGLGDKRETISIAYDPANTSTASFEANTKESMKKNKYSREEVLEIDTIDNLIAKMDLPEPDFVKIDVEGFESQVLAGMKGLLEKKHPALFIELHGIDDARKKENIKQVLSRLSPFYPTITHVETGTTFSSTSSNPPFSGHIYCKF